MTPKANIRVSMYSRLLPCSALSLALWAAPGLAQEVNPAPTPAPSPAPAASPAETSNGEGVRIEAEVDAALRNVNIDRSLIEREARRAARKMATSDEIRTKVAKEAQAASEIAAREAAIGRDVAMQVARAVADAAVHESRAEREEAIREAMEEQREAMEEQEEAVREAMEEAQQTAKEKAEEAREREKERLEAAREKAEAAREKAKERAEEARERERERLEANREREQEARERAREKADEARERDRERREAQRERQRGEGDRVDELYDDAMSSIDEEDWNAALRPLNRLIALNTRVDAALYWSSYAQGKLNRSAMALASLARLQKDFPTSRWAKEGKALELEVRGKSGQTPRPDQEEDLDLKLMAVSALAQSDPQEAMPLLTKILTSPTAPRKVRERSLFVLAQIGSEQASAAIAEVARGNSSPELQRKAIQYLGIFGQPTNRKVLSEIYSSSTDNTIRKQILNSFMVSGDKARVLTAAKTEKDPALRADAIRLLGVMGGTAELSQMYSTATTADEKKDILHALFIGGAVEPVAAAARGEKDKEVRLAAVRNLGLMGRKSQDVLSEMYKAETDPEVKKEVLNAFFLQGNVTRLIEVARVEKDPLLKKDAVHWLSLMNSKESRAYMMELLKD